MVLLLFNVRRDVVLELHYKSDEIFDIRCQVDYFLQDVSEVMIFAMIWDFGKRVNSVQKLYFVGVD